VVVVVAALLVAVPAGAASVDDRLSRAHSARDVKLARLHELQTELDVLLDRYAKLERRAGRASVDLVTAAMAEQTAELYLEEAQARLDERVRTAYEIGPGGVMNALLGAASFADLFAAVEYTARTISVDRSQVETLTSAAADLQARRERAEAARAAFAPRQRRLGALLSKLKAKVEEAQRLADRAGIRVQRLERQLREIQEAAARQVGRHVLAIGATGRDQSALLALLGPTGGRTCDTPKGLVDTGKSFDGYASWYGWEFGGQSTANGAIFDPRLFTAANRWLPFGTFLRIHYRNRCAIVLVNDRGPYGNLERVIDLSMASAHYLGVGVSWVTADILVPRDGIPA
jgi:peptidoglycan hydrolase CwlO-like protein